MPLNPYKADLHIHTVLSPCGDLEMSPTAIVDRALERGLDMIAISDHNTTRQVKVTQKVGKEKGLFVLGGVEVTSQEEAHCLCFFETDEQLDQMQAFLDEHLPKIPNDEDRFGYQLIVDENEEIVGESMASTTRYTASVASSSRHTSTRVLPRSQVSWVSCRQTFVPMGWKSISLSHATNSSRSSPT